FCKQMMRPQAVAMVARMHDDRVVAQAKSLQATKNGTDALIDQGNQSQIALFNAAIFVGGNPKEKLMGQTLPINNRPGLLPFTHKPIAQRNIVALGKRGGRIELDLAQRMLIVKRTIVRRVRLDKCDHQDERIAKMFFDELARVLFEKFRSR